MNDGVSLSELDCEGGDLRSFFLSFKEREAGFFARARGERKGEKVGGSLSFFFLFSGRLFSFNCFQEIESECASWAVINNNNNNKRERGERGGVIRVQIFSRKKAKKYKNKFPLFFLFFFSLFYRRAGGKEARHETGAGKNGVGRENNAVEPKEKKREERKK